MTHWPQDGSEPHDHPPREGGGSADAADTGERLYTPEELERWAAAQERADAVDEPGDTTERPARQADPLSDPLPDPLRDPLTDPLTDPLPGPVGDPLTGPMAGAPVVPPTAGAPSGRPPAPPSGPPPSGPPTGPPTGPPPPAVWTGAPSAPPAPAAPAAPSAAPTAPTAPPTAAPAGGPPAVVRPASVPATVGPASPVPAAGGATEPAGPHVSATEFLDRRDRSKDVGPASWGWRGRVRRWTGGVVKPRMSARELAYHNDRALIQKDFDGPRTIAFVNPKGGAAKTTGVLAAGFTFGTVRGGGVVAWDNNETRGTLGIRGTRSAHRNTTRELLEDLERFKDVYHSRIGDLGAFVRSQGDAHFDVLASDERPDVTGMIHADDFREVHRLLERFYRIILIDTGNNMRAENWLAAAESADLMVVTTTVREDTGYSGLWMLDALQDAGYADLKYRTLTVLSDPSPKVDTHLADDLTQVYEQRTRGVYRVPYDPALVSGSVVPYAALSEETTMSWLRACAGMAAAL